MLSNGQNAAIAYNGNGDPLKLPVFATTPTPTTFDPEDRLASLNVTPAFHAVYDGDRLVAEENAQGGLLGFYLWGATGRDLRYWLDPSGPTTLVTAFAYDPQGSLVEPATMPWPDHVLSNLATVSWASAYDAYGSAATFPAYRAYDSTEPVGFGGEWGYDKDGATGLYLLTHRYYDAGVGRFVTRDPIGYGGGINLYGFAGNNPVNESDPSGYQAEELDKDEIRIYVKSKGFSISVFLPITRA